MRHLVEVQVDGSERRLAGASAYAVVARRDHHFVGYVTARLRKEAPGMIDAHHHLTQSFGKSLAYGEPSEIFRRVWVPLESSLNDEFVYPLR